MNSQLNSFTDVLCGPDEICDSQPLSLSSNENVVLDNHPTNSNTLDDKHIPKQRPVKRTGQYGQFRSVEEIDEKYRSVFSYPFFNLVQSKVIDDALYTDKSMVVSAPTGSGKTVVFEMAIVQLLMEMEDCNYTENFKIIYMAPVKALCTERLTEWYPKFTKLGLFCIEVTGDTDVDFSQLAPYRIIITTPEKWDMLTRRWRDYRSLVEQIKLFLIDEVHILNDPVRGPVLEAVVSRMKTIESSAQSAHRIEQLQKQYRGEGTSIETPPKIRFIAVSATVGNPDDVASWLGNADRPAVYNTFGDESRPVKLRRVVEGYPCREGTSIFKFDIILNYKLWPIIQKYHDGKPTLIFCNTRKSVLLTAETLSREITITFTPEQKAKLTALASTFKNKKLQSLVLSGVGCHHAGLLFEERTNIEHAFRNRNLPILITTTTLAMGVNLPAHLVIIKNTQQYVNGAYQEYSISTVLQMVGRAGRPQYDTEATAVIMTRITDKGRYQALVGGSEPLQSYLHKRLAENLNSEAALGTVGDVAQCVQWLRSTFLFVRAARDPKRYLGLPQAAPQNQISKKIEELCVKAMNGLASSGLITMDEASCIESTEAGRLMSIYYLDLETMKHIMKINGTESLEQLLWIVCESHELADMHLRVDERRYLNALNRNNSAATIRFPMKGKITTRQMKVNCLIQAVLGCLPIADPSLNQEAMKIMRIADRVCKCLIAYVTQPSLLSTNPKYYSVVLNSAILAKCVVSHLWEQSPYVSKQLRGIGPTFSTLLATAGKVNFMTLEESHPRDLERIMKRGAPAGNLLRKEINLLPKYQLTMTPIDEKSVIVQLDLLNCSYLMENIDNLTAGNIHKCYIIVGDSENHILLLQSFNDKNLISVYNGTITFEISRIHSFEHKIFAHCISSTFAGIDANCDYNFKDLEPLPKIVNETPKRPIQKQTTITDTFKERKRKCSDSDITPPKEKKKRDSNIITKFQNLKESFGKTSKVIRDNLERTTIISNKTLGDFNQFYEPFDVSREVNDSYVKPVELIDEHPIENNDNNFDEVCYGVIDDCNDEFDEINDDKINDILNEIESEMTHGNMQPIQNPHLKKSQNITSINLSAKATTKSRNDTQFKRLNATQMNKCTKNILPVKSNYNFIDLLERNVEFNDDEEKEPNTIKQSGFSLNIKQYIDKYLNQVQKQDKLQDKELTELIETTNKNRNEVSISECTDNSDLPEYVELNKVTTLPIIKEQNEIIENSPNNENVLDQVPKEIRTSEPYEQLKIQHTMQNNVDTTDLHKSTNDQNNVSVLKNDQNEKGLKIPNTEISVNDKNTVVQPQKQNESLICAETNFVNSCHLTNDIRRINNASYENLDRQISTSECTENCNLTNDMLCVNNVSYKNVDRQISTLEYANSCNSTNYMSHINKASYENVEKQMTTSESANNYKLTNNMTRINNASHENLGRQISTLEYAKNCNLTNDMPRINDDSYENVDRQISTLECANSCNVTDQMSLINNCAFENVGRQMSTLECENSCNLTNYMPRIYNDSYENVTKMLEYKYFNENPNFTTNIQENRCINLEENNTNTMDLQTFNKDPIVMDVDAQFKMKPDEIEQANCPLVSQLINKSKSLTLENEISTEGNTHNLVCIDNIPCKKTTRNINNCFTESQQKNQSGYVKKYSYTSGHTNVITKITDDSIMKITRKLHLNLDITEILQNDTICKVNEDSPNSSTIIDVSENKAICKASSVIDNQQQAITFNNFVNDQMNKTTPQQDFNVKFYSSDSPTKSNCSITDPRYSLRENAKEIDTKNSSLTNKSKAITDTTAEQEFEHEFKANEFAKVDKTENNSNQNVVSNTEENTNTKNKIINNILHKYSEIMRKRTTVEANNQNTIQNIQFRSNKQQTVIPKRPFKISDLDKCNSQLPNITQISQQTKPLNTNINESKVTITKVQKPEHNLKPVDFSKHNNYDPMPDKDNEIPVLDRNIIEPDYYQPLEDPSMSNDNAEEIPIDPTMFNPKTLLQCFSNDDDVNQEEFTLVPPPLEFCDSDSDSPKVSPKEIDLPAEFYDPKYWNDDFDSVNNSSIFQSDLDVDLTPTKEIETWTLSQNNENKNAQSLRFQPPSQSYTVLNENSFNNNSLYNATMNRHIKLGKFKFTKKRKLKL